MVITFREKRKRLKFLIPILVIVILITVVINWRDFFVKEKPLPEIIKPAKKIEIDFQVLKNPELEELQLFEKIPPFEEELGGENPFIPY